MWPGPLQPHSRNRSATVAPLSRPLSTLPGPMACSSWLRSQPLRGGSTRPAPSEGPVAGVYALAELPEASLPGNCCSRSCRQRSGSLQIRTGGCPSARSTTQPGSRAWPAAVAPRVRQIGGDGCRRAQSPPPGWLQRQRCKGRAERCQRSRRLVVRLQQHHLTALAGQQCCPGEAGNAGPQHHHIC